MKKETMIKVFVKIITKIVTSITLVLISIKEGLSREEAGKILITAILLFIFFCLSFLISWVGFLFGLWLIWFIHKKMNHKTATE